jgi:hypothetical protein
MLVAYERTLGGLGLGIITGIGIKNIEGLDGRFLLDFLRARLVGFRT